MEYSKNERAHLFNFYYSLLAYFLFLLVVSLLTNHGFRWSLRGLGLNPLQTTYYTLDWVVHNIDVLPTEWYIKKRILFYLSTCNWVHRASAFVLYYPTPDGEGQKVQLQGRAGLTFMINRLVNWTHACSNSIHGLMRTDSLRSRGFWKIPPLNTVALGIKFPKPKLWGTYSSQGKEVQFKSADFTPY